MNGSNLVLRTVATHTVGISPKVWGPFALGVATIATNWISSGEFDRTELALTLMTASTAALGYVMKPGPVEARLPELAKPVEV